MSACEHSASPIGFEQKELIALIPHMRAFARSLCRDVTLADDLTQDALTSALRGRDRFTPGTNLKAWLFRIMRNQLYSDRRRSWRWTELDQKQAEETLVAVSNPLAALELEDVRAAMAALSDEHREALALVAVAGMSYEEAAEVAGCPAGTMKSRVSRGRHKLAALLDGEPPSGGASASNDAVSSRYAARDSAHCIMAA